VEEAAKNAGEAIESTDSTSIEDAGSAADEASTSIDNMGSSANDAAGELENTGEAGEAAGEMTAESMMAATAAIGAMTAGLEIAAETINDVNIQIDQLSVLSGLTSDELRGAVAEISNVTFPQSEAIQYIDTLSQLGVTGQDVFMTQATNMDKINDAFGIGSDNAAKLTGQMVALGVPVNDLSQGFNALSYIQNNAIGRTEGFTQGLRKIGPAAVESGLNMDQLAIAYSKATQEAGTAQGGTKLLNSALKDAGKDIGALERELGLLPGTLSNASQATAVYEGQIDDLAQAEADHKTLLQEAKAYLEDLSLEYGEGISVVASFGGALGGLSSIVTAAMTTKMALASATSVETAAENVSTVSKIRNSAATAAHTAIEGARTAATYAATSATWLLNIAMSANPALIVVLAIVALIAVLWYLFNTNEDVRNALIETWNAISGTVLNAVNKAGDYIRQLPQIVWNEMMNVGRMIFGARDYIFQQVMNVFGNIVHWAMQALGIASPGFIARAIAGEMDYVVSGIIDAQSGAFAAAQGLSDAILGGFGNPMLSAVAPSYGSASVGFDATEINSVLNANGNSQPNVVNYNNTTVNQEGIMSQREAAEFIVQAITEQLRKENMISGKGVQ